MSSRPESLKDREYSMQSQPFGEVPGSPMGHNNTLRNIAGMHADSYHRKPVSQRTEHGLQQVSAVGVVGDAASSRSLLHRNTETDQRVHAQEAESKAGPVGASGSHRFDPKFEKHYDRSSPSQQAKTPPRAPTHEVRSSSRGTAKEKDEKMDSPQAQPAVRV